MIKSWFLDRVFNVMNWVAGLFGFYLLNPKELGATLQLNPEELTVTKLSAMLQHLGFYVLTEDEVKRMGRFAIHLPLRIHDQISEEYEKRREKILKTSLP